MRSRVMFAALAAVMSFGLVAPASAQQTLTIASLLGPDKPETKVWVKFQELVDAELPGQFTFNIVPNAALGGEREVAEGTRLGSIQGSLSTLANMSAWVPAGQVFDMPFMFRGPEHIAKVMNGPIGEEFKAKYEAQGFHVLGYTVYGARHLLAKKVFTEPAGVKGVRMRVIQSPLHTQLWESLGAQPTPIPITEVYNGLETGLVDMMDLTLSAYVGFKLYEVVPDVILTGHIWALGIMFVGEDTWKGLTAEQQAVFTKAGKQAAAYFNDLMLADNKASLEEAEAKGAKAVEPDHAAWREAVQPFWQSYAPKVGGIELVRRIADTE